MWGRIDSINAVGQYGNSFATSSQGGSVRDTVNPKSQSTYNYDAIFARS